MQWVTSAGEQGRTTPQALRWWPDMAVGQTRHFEVESSGTPATGEPWKRKHKSAARVVARERVKVPAGEFQALPVEHVGTASNIGSYGFGTFKITVW